MVGYRKLALLAAIAAGWVASEAKASTMSPFTEPDFFLYYSNDKSGQYWHRGASFLMYFVHWSSDNPATTVQNVSWVERWSANGDRLISNDQTRYLDYPTDKIDDSIPPWSRATIPEPATALLVGGFMGIVALRRRMI